MILIRWAKSSLEWRNLIRYLFLFLGMVWISYSGGSLAAAVGPSWKVGRALIQPVQDRMGHIELVLKLSLRNEGSPGTLPVMILGQWRVKGPVEKKDFIRLGQFTREVAQNQTTILEVPLNVLGPVPGGKPPLEVVILTGQMETDHQVFH